MPISFNFIKLYLELRWRFHLKPMNKLRWMDRCIVVVKHPVNNYLQARLFPSRRITYEHLNFQIILSVHRLTYWSLFMMNNTFLVKENSNYYPTMLLLWIVAFQVSSTVKIGLLSLDHSHTPVTHHKTFLNISRLFWINFMLSLATWSLDHPFDLSLVAAYGHWNATPMLFNTKQYAIVD